MLRLRWLIGRHDARRRHHQRASILIVVLLGLATVSQLPGVAPALAADPLFTPANAPADAAVAAATSGDRSIRRSRQVNVDFEQLTGPKKSGPDGRRVGAQGSSTLALNLFDDVSLTADIRSVTRTSSGAGLVLTGSVQGGGPDSSVAIVAENGIMTANVRPSPDRLFQVRYAGGRTHAIHEIDKFAFPVEDDHDVGLQVPPGSLGSAPTQAANLQAADTNNVIDVLVVYTPAARAQVGGTAAINGVIDLALSETNQGYANSGVIQRISVVHRAEVAYTEQPPNPNGSSGFNTDLNRLASTTDGILDNVHTLRNTYGADFVSLVRTGDTATVTPLCGIAPMIFGEGGPSNLTVAYGAPRAFTVVAQNCMTGNYTFAHELGHTMGVRHNIEADPTQNQPYTYNHGYCALTGTPPYRDIMAVNLSCNN